MAQEPFSNVQRVLSRNRSKSQLWPSVGRYVRSRIWFCESSQKFAITRLICVCKLNGIHHHRHHHRHRHHPVARPWQDIDVFTSLHHLERFHARYHAELSQLWLKVEFNGTKPGQSAPEPVRWETVERNTKQNLYATKCYVHCDKNEKLNTSKRMTGSRSYDMQTLDCGPQRPNVFYTLLTVSFGLLSLK